MKDVKILIDKNKSGKNINWKGKKLKTIDLAECYKRLGFKKAYRVEECGSYLAYKYLNENEKKLYRANFCKDRLCPMCCWRRSLKIFGQVSKVMNKTLENNDYRFIF
ncbi:protein rep, partial [Clostridium tarantellae]|uniref:protein rep n=1 Tax=Clostridium tarantellae TaxID=39493 RepID=UPI0014787085